MNNQPSTLSPIDPFEQSIPLGQLSSTIFLHFISISQLSTTLLTPNFNAVTADPSQAGIQARNGKSDWVPFKFVPQSAFPTPRTPFPLAVKTRHWTNRHLPWRRNLPYPPPSFKGFFLFRRGDICRCASKIKFICSSRGWWAHKKKERNRINPDWS